MPRTTATEVQAELLEFAEILLLSSDLLADSAEELEEDLAILIPKEVQDIYDPDDGDRFVAEILELEGLFWLEAASSLTGDGSHGRYNQYPKSKDFFSTSLQNPDCQFRHLFWCVIQNSVKEFNIFSYIGLDATPLTALLPCLHIIQFLCQQARSPNVMSSFSLHPFSSDMVLEDLMSLVLL